MIRVKVLGSSSKGNAVVVECGVVRLLIDGGFSAKRLTEFLLGEGIEPSTLAAILITHAHIDHVRGVGVFSKKWNLPVYGTWLMMDSWTGCPEGIAWRHFESGQRFDIEGVMVQSIKIPHDCADPVAFRIDFQGVSYGHLSDVGHKKPEIVQAFQGVHGFFIESNYDKGLLAADYKRPLNTKQRIGGAHGHLSNEQAGEIVRDVAHVGLHQVILGHLSEDCNTPTLAMNHMAQSLGYCEGCVPTLHCAHPDHPLDWIEIVGTEAVFNNL